jgi:hypothetical protein
LAPWFFNRHRKSRVFILSFLLAAAAFAQAWSSGAFNRTSNQQISPKAWPGMPLAFIENRGQADARAAFLAQGRDTTAYFTAQGLTLAFTQPGDEKSARAKSTVRQRWNLKLDFVGANTAGWTRLSTVRLMRLWRRSIRAGRRSPIAVTSAAMTKTKVWG